MNDSALDFKMMLRSTGSANVERGSWVCWPKAFGFGVGYVESVEISGGVVLVKATEAGTSDYDGDLSAEEGGRFNLLPSEFWVIEKHKEDV